MFLSRNGCEDGITAVVVFVGRGGAINCVGGTFVDAGDVELGDGHVARLWGVLAGMCIAHEG